MQACHFKTHPDFNKSGKEWHSSPVGEFYKLKGYESLFSNKMRDGNDLVDRPQETRQQDKSSNKTKKKQTLYKHKHNKQSKLLTYVKPTRQLCNICTLSKQNTTNKINKLIYASFIQNKSALRVQTLLDTGGVLITKFKVRV